MKILGISGSLKSTSANTSILEAASKLAKENININIYTGLESLPHFNPDIDGDTPPTAVKELREALKSADGLIISSPEYALGIPGSLKNLLDWTVSSGELVNKPTAVITASPSYTGGENAFSSLLLTLSAVSANIPTEGRLIIPAVNKKIDAEGNLTDPETAENLRNLLEALTLTINENQSETI